jgi:hypothetical protein
MNICGHEENGNDTARGVVAVVTWQDRTQITHSFLLTPTLQIRPNKISHMKMNFRKKKFWRSLRKKPKRASQQRATVALQVQPCSSTKSDDTFITRSSSSMADTEDAVAAADKQMEERAARAKALLAQRYQGLRTDQVILDTVAFVLLVKSRLVLTTTFITGRTACA